MSKPERDYQANLVKRIKKMFDGCVVLKNDSGYLQGVPDLTILYGTFWAVLEVKRSDTEDYEPNQEYYIEMFNNMSFAAMICPQNEEDVLRDLQYAFQPCGAARVS